MTTHLNMTITHDTSKVKAELEKMFNIIYSKHSMPCFTFNTDEDELIVYIQPNYDKGSIEYGTCITNAGLIVEDELLYDEMFNIEVNLNAVYDSIQDYYNLY